MGPWEGRERVKNGSLALALLPPGAWHLEATKQEGSGGLAQRTPAEADAGGPCPFQVRLLTGMGRYNEMTYIFDLLHKKHYFEVLMRKKLDPVGVWYFKLQDGTY